MRTIQAFIVPRLWLLLKTKYKDKAVYMLHLRTPAGHVIHIHSIHSKQCWRACLTFCLPRLVGSWAPGWELLDQELLGLCYFHAAVTSALQAILLPLLLFFVYLVNVLLFVHFFNNSIVFQLSIRICEVFLKFAVSRAGFLLMESSLSSMFLWLFKFIHMYRNNNVID